MGYFPTYDNNQNPFNIDEAFDLLEIVFLIITWLIQSRIAINVIFKFFSLVRKTNNNFRLILLTNFVYFWALPKLFEINVVRDDFSPIIFYPISKFILNKNEYNPIAKLLTPILDEILLGVPLSFLAHKLFIKKNKLTV